MIFVTVGGGPYYSFDRLLKKMDEISLKGKYKIVMQTGCSSYVPQNAEYFKFDSMERMIDYYKKAHAIVAHTSGAPVMYARNFNLPLILVPRMEKFGEIFDDHQLKTAKRMENENMVEVVYDVNMMENSLEDSLAKRGKKWVSTGGRGKVIERIKSFLEGVGE